ncbi:MAG: effector binding domain-containing protein [Ruminococcus sp.]|nr:effector binding domain-containing protein [Ruminococcus sp.]
MDWIKSLKSAMDCLEENLEENFEEETYLEKAARKMNVSASYFVRIFTIVCGITPAEYVRRRRLSLAGSELAAGSIKVTDAAVKYGWNTPEGFTRAFVRFHGATPAEVIKGSVPVRSYSPLQVTINVKGGTSMEYKIIELPEFKVLEKAETHSVVNSQNLNSIPDFWDRAKKDGTIDVLMKNFAEGENDIYGICYGNSSDKDKTFEYAIACRCKEGCEPPEGFRIRTIPTRTWAVFECVGAMPGAIQQTWHRIVTEFFPSSDLAPTYEMDIEVYPEGDMLAEGYVSRIMVPCRRQED